jgi:uncharacterized integral membrane protein
VKFLSWIVFLLIGIATVALAVANRHAVVVSFDPLPFSYDIPLFAVALAAVFIGLIVGFAVSWLGGHKWRRMARERGRRLHDLEGEVGRLKSQLATPSPRQDTGGLPQASQATPALPANRADAA